MTDLTTQTTAKKPKSGHDNKTKTTKKKKKKTTMYTWDDRIRQLQSFRHTYGHVKVQSTLHETKYPGLSTWIRHVRRTYKQELLQSANSSSSGSSSSSGGMDVCNRNSNSNSNRTFDLENDESVNIAKEKVKRQKRMEKLQQFLNIVNGTNHSSIRIQSSSDVLQIVNNHAFVWNVNEHSWNVRYEQLVDFHRTHDHCRVPNNDVQYPGLGIWVRNQRREYRKLQQQQQEPHGTAQNESEMSSRSNAKSTLTPERLQLLQRLNFEWYKSHTTAWEDQYYQLLEFYHQYNHSNVPQNYITNTNNVNDVSLGKWCMNQRTAYKNQKRNTNNGSPNNITNSNSSSSSTVTTSTTTTTISCNALTSERIQLLEAVQFQWNMKSMKWKQMLQRLRLYYDAHHQSVTIPVNDTMNTDLRIWMNLQRYYYHNTIILNKKLNSTTATTSSSKPTTTNQLPSRTLSSSRIQRMERTIPNFQWAVRGSKKNGPSSEDWFLLFEEMRKKGIGPNVRPKQHWFEGINIQNIPIKGTPYTEQELLALWNEEDDDDDDDMNENVNKI